MGVGRRDEILGRIAELRVPFPGSSSRCLEEAVDSDDGASVGWIKVNPEYDPYRDDPRFQAILARVGLAD